MPGADACPCGSGLDYAACCGEIHRRGAGMGCTAEQLMRARYCAYVQHNAEFLLGSWYPSERPTAIDFDPDLQWLGLDVVRTEAGGAFDTEGVVEFIARFRHRRGESELHETSRFRRVDGVWAYVDGQ